MVLPNTGFVIVGGSVFVVAMTVLSCVIVVLCPFLLSTVAVTVSLFAM